MTEPRYQMTVDLNVLKHLGINLYSNLAAVLTEAVANAWDADATEVDIRVDQGKDQITIRDNGIGMSVEDVNEKYLKVGYQRRKGAQEERTDGGRLVMGRKGLGKLSLFSIAEIVEVQSVKQEEGEEGEKHGLRMDVKGIEDAGGDTYVPEELKPEEVEVERGTWITLRKINRQRLDVGLRALDKRLARRFSIFGGEFQVSIDGKPLSSAGISPVQYLWKLGDDEANLPEYSRQAALEDSLSAWKGKQWRIGGWLGTAKEPKDLDGEAGNLNGIVVLARGRLFHENILDQLNDGRIYTKYLTGRIQADFLDADDQDDIATSDRQRIREDDPRYEALNAFLKERLGQVEKQWLEWREQDTVRKAEKQSPALAGWLLGLPEGHRKSAKKMIGAIGRVLPMSSKTAKEDRKLLYKHGILAFERMRLRGSEAELAGAVEDRDKLLRLLGDSDAFEASLYRDIVRNRLAVIRQFETRLDANAKERVLQEYLFEHLWLLDPAWERAKSTARMEKKFKLIPAEADRIGRVDIAYRTVAGMHVVVELKRADRSMKATDLSEQGHRYVQQLKASLQEDNLNVEVVFVLGKKVQETDPGYVKRTIGAVSPGSRIVLYDQLIGQAQQAYAEYLEQSREFDRVDEIVGQL